METTIETKKYGIKDLFQYKSYILKLFGTLISRFGDSLDSIAYGWMVYTLTGSKILMGTIFAVNAIPNIIFSPFAGVFVDRWKKKKVVMLCNIGRGAVVTLTAVLFMFNLLSPWHLFVFTFLNSTFESFEGPASASMLAILLPKELFLTANSFSSSITKILELMGLASAGIIIAILGIGGAILIDGITFFIAALLTFLIKLTNDEISKETLTINNFFNELKSGFKFVRKTKLIFITVLLMAFINFCLSPLNILQPIFVKDILKSGPEVLSILGICVMFGMILGGLLVGQFGSNFKNSTLIILGFCILGTNYALLYIPGNINISFISPIIISAILYFFLGISVPIATAPISTYLLQNTPKELLGRIFSLLSMSALCALPLGSFVTGIVSEYISISVLFLLMGAAIIIVSISLTLCKDFRNA